MVIHSETVPVTRSIIELNGRYTVVWAKGGRDLVDIRTADTLDEAWHLYHHHQPVPFLES